MQRKKKKKSNKDSSVIYTTTWEDVTNREIQQVVHAGDWSEKIETAHSDLLVLLQN